MKHVHWTCDVCGTTNRGVYVRPVTVNVGTPVENVHDHKAAVLTRDLCESCVSRLLNDFDVYLGSGILVPDRGRRFRNQPITAAVEA